MVICRERGADLHIAQLMPVPLTVSCFRKIQIGFTFLVPACPGSPGQRAVKRVCVCVLLHFLAEHWFPALEVITLARENLRIISDNRYNTRGFELLNMIDFNPLIGK